MKQMKAKDYKTFSGFLIVCAIVLFLVALLMGQWFAAVAIPIAYLLGAMVVTYSVRARSGKFPNEF